MAQRKRQYGSGCLLRRKGGWVLRWRETETSPDGTRKRVLRYERLGEMSRKHAADILMQRVAAANTTHVVAPLTWTFRELAAQWQATVLPMYKPSTQKNHRHILAKHLLPRFGDGQLTELGRQDVQAYVASLCQDGYAPKTVDHIHDVLSAILRTAVKWDHLVDNPARGVDLPRLVTVRPKWALTVPQAANLLEALPALPKTLVGLALLTGVRRGELFALRWRDLDISRPCLIIREAVYEGTFSTPKTTAGLRMIPLSSLATKLAQTWRRQARRTGANDLMFGTRTGKPISPNNVLRRWIRPACEALDFPPVSWLTFRRTFSSWSHQQGVPSKVTAELMGHRRVDLTLNTYTQVMPNASREAVRVIADELFTIVHTPERGVALTH